MRADAVDVFVHELGVSLLMRNRDYQQGANLSDEALMQLNFAICVPLVIVLATPLLLELLLRTLQWRRLRKAKRRAAAAVTGLEALSIWIEAWGTSVISRIDAATEQTVKGDELVRKKSPLGGACTLVAYAVFLCFIVTTLSQFLFSNTVVTASSMPLALYERSKFSLLRPFDLASAGAATAATVADLAGLLPTGTFADRSSGGSGGGVAGIVVSIATAGRLCGQLASVKFLTLSGAFTNTSSFDARTGEASHTFVCADCMLDERSELTASFDSSCASFGVTVVSVGAWGSVMVSHFAAADASAVSASLRFSLEVVQDSVYGSVDAQGYVQGGRSVYGQFQTSVTNVSIAPYSAPAANAGALSTVALALVAENNYQIVFLYSNLTAIQVRGTPCACTAKVSADPLAHASCHLPAAHCLARRSAGHARHWRASAQTVPNRGQQARAATQVACCHVKPTASANNVADSRSSGELRRPCGAAGRC